ncbi:MAG: ABC transporter permease [Anaerolineales bacterium]|nr:ABC transporter permease [Anaerolineales bacterium]
MRNILLVMRYELTTTLTRRSFLLMAFGVPLLAVLVFTVVSVIKSEPDDSTAPSSPAGTGDLAVEGYVDHSGWITEIPDDLPAGILVAFADKESAQAAQTAGEISSYYIVPEDFIESGELIYIIPNYGPSSSGGQEWIIQRTMLYNLLGADETLTNKVLHPMDLQITNLAPQQGQSAPGEDDCSSPGYACKSYALVRMLPFIVVILFFVFLSTGSGLLIRGLSSEKQNQVMEILMASISPQQLLAGKIAGLGIAGMLQTIVWIGTGYSLLSTGGNILNLPPGFEVPTSILTWGLVYFLLGYAIYATLMAGAGALVPDTKAVTSASWFVMLPLFVGYFIAVTPIGLEAPHGPLATVLSLFPLTAPVVMVMRLTVGGMPFWHPLLGAVLLALTAALIVRAVARMFHAQNLLSGQPFSARRYLAALINQ